MQLLKTTAQQFQRPPRSPLSLASKTSRPKTLLQCMSQIAPSSGPAFVGKSSGTIPNLFWRRITFDQLRAQIQYQGLPPLEQLRLQSTLDFRQVRQESQLWTQLHQGLLTTGRLNAALGFYEPAAAKRLGIPRDRINHNALLSAIANLQLPAYGLQLLDIPASPLVSVQATTATAPASVQGLQGAITVGEYEAHAIKLASAAAPIASGVKSKPKHRRSQKQRSHQQQQPHQQAATNTTGSAAAAAVGARTSAANAAGAGNAVTEGIVADPYGTADARRKRCQLVATRGEGGLRMAWGSTQEAAALFSVMHLFPHSQLSEVGLCWVDPQTQIPSEWGIPAGDLPPLGASPDSLIMHRAASGCLPSRTPSAVSSLGPQVSLDHSTAMQSSGAQPSAPSDAAQSCDPALAELELLLAKLQPGLSQASCQNSSFEPASQSQSAATAAARTANTALPVASPGMQGPSVAAASQLSAAAAPFKPRPAAAQSLQHRPLAAAGAASASAAASVTSTSQHPAPPAASLAAVASAHPANTSQVAQSEAGDWLEAVEIKNVCPFREARDVSCNAKRRLYRVADPGPYSRVPCHFVPQLQMEMLASGAQSALVVSRSATKGLRVFRMHRHADFLKQMLHTISQLYTKYVRTYRAPPHNIFMEQAAYQQFLKTTVEVASSAEVIVDVDTQALPGVQDCSMFL